MTTKGLTTIRECASMRLLAEDGWTTGELKMCFHLCRAEQVRTHVCGRCRHDHGIAPLPEWNGENGKPELRLAPRQRVGNDFGR